MSNISLHPSALQPPHLPLLLLHRSLNLFQPQLFHLQLLCQLRRSRLLPLLRVLLLLLRAQLLPARPELPRLLHGLPVQLLPALLPRLLHGLLLPGLLQELPGLPPALLPLLQPRLLPGLLLRLPPALLLYELPLPLLPYELFLLQPSVL